MVPHFAPDAAALLLIDYQVGTLQLVPSQMLVGDAPVQEPTRYRAFYRVRAEDALFA